MTMNRCILSLVIVIVALSASAHDAWCQNEEQGIGSWSRAHEAFVEHITPRLATWRENDPDVQYAEIRSELFSKYLPDLRIYVTDPRNRASGRVFFVTQQGEIQELPEAPWTAESPDDCFRLTRLTEFLVSRGIRVRDEHEAIEVARLVDAIQSAPHKIWFLRENTNNYTVFDERFLSGYSTFCTKADWEYRAARTADGWTVTVSYVGPPVSISMPPTYAVDVSEEHLFTDIRKANPLSDRCQIPSKSP